jgi:hypothetical protein
MMTKAKVELKKYKRRGGEGGRKPTGELGGGTRSEAASPARCICSESAAGSHSPYLPLSLPTNFFPPMALFASVMHIARAVSCAPYELQ